MPISGGPRRSKTIKYVDDTEIESKIEDDEIVKIEEKQKTNHIQILIFEDGRIEKRIVVE